MALHKCIIMLCILFQIAEASRCKEYDSIWKAFKKTYQKKYCKREEIRRRCIFDNACSRIVKHNLECDLGLHTYRMGLNKYSDLSHEEFVSRFNGFRGTPESRKNRHLNRFPRLLSAKNHPKMLDYRIQNLVTPVKDQAACGACWAFSAVAALESQTKKVTNRTVLLSEQNLVDCSSPYGNDGCQGGLMTQAFRYIRENDGIQTESSYPYKAKNGRCVFEESNVGATLRDYEELNTGEERELLDALVNAGPISVGLDGSLRTFQDYKDGVYDDSSCSSEYLDHAVLLIGYGTENGADYWLIKNSYGTSWGENGYGKMVRNKNNQCGIATQASYPIV